MTREGRHLPVRITSRFRGATPGIAVAALLGTALSACGNGGAAASGGKTLRWASSYFPTHWDPVVGGSGAQFRELALVYASLTRTDEQGNAVPDLAKSWDYDSSGTEVTFH